MWPGPPPEQVTAWMLVQAGHVIGRRFTRAFAAVGLTPTQFGVLLMLDLQPGLSGGELARRTAVTPQNISGLVASLVDLGLVERDPAPGRGHKVAAHLTPTGEEALRRAHTALQTVSSPTALGLDDDEAATLNALLRRIITVPWNPPEASGTGEGPATG